MKCKFKSKLCAHRAGSLLLTQVMLSEACEVNGNKSEDKSKIHYLQVVAIASVVCV